MALAEDDFTRFLVARNASDIPRVFAQLAFRLAAFILKVEVTAALSIIPAAGNALTKTRANARGALRRASRGALVALRPNPGGVGESADGTFVAFCEPVSVWYLPPDIYTLSSSPGAYLPVALRY